MIRLSAPFADADEPLPSQEDSRPTSSDLAKSHRPDPVTESMPDGVPMSPATVERGPGGSANEEALGTKYKTSIAILPSSLPEYHRAYLKKLKDDEERADGPPHGEPRQPSAAEQAVTARHLKAHGRSSLNTDKAGGKPESLTPLPARKAKQLRWQFGIRSRNPPLDAMLCLYRALAKAGAEWEEPETDEASWHGSVDVGDNMMESKWSGSGSYGEGKSRRADDRGHRVTYPQRGDEVGPHDHAIESSTPESDDCMPQDPWIIRCRWLKEGMGPSGSLATSSNRSSKGNLAAVEPMIKGGVDLHSSGGPAGATGPGSASGSIIGTAMESVDKVYVYMDIQLYQIERDFYLVDFKCAGYERVVEMAVEHDAAAAAATTSESGAVDGGATSGPPGREGERKSKRKVKRLIGRRYRPEEKKVSSPFPFLDIASKLIVALAEGG